MFQTNKKSVKIVVKTNKNREAAGKSLRKKSFVSHKSEIIIGHVSSQVKQLLSSSIIRN